MDKHKIWPLNPDHISNDRGDLLGGLGIVPNWHLERELTAIAGNLGHPIMFLEFPTEIDKPPFLTQSKATGVKLRPSCGIFRESEYKIKCYETENRLASVFRDINVSNFESEFIEKVKQSGIADEFKPTSDHYFELKKDKRQWYLECDCPILGYRALTFPMIVEEKVIGVLYVGGLCLFSRLGFIEKVMNENKKLYGPCIKEALSKHLKWKNDKRNTLGAKKYRSVIENTIDELKRLISKSNERLNRQRQNFIESKVAGYVSTFYHDLPKGPEMPLGNTGLDKLWEIVQSTLEKIKKDFKIEHISLFSTKKFQIDPPSKLDLVANTGGVSKSNRPTRYHKFDLDEIPKEAMTHRMISTDHPELFRGLTEEDDELDKDRNFIRVLPATSPSSMIVTWVVYRQQWNPISNRKFSKSGKALERLIRSFYAIVVSAHTSILAATAKDNMEKSLRVYRHEVGQLTSGMDALRETYISNGDSLRLLSQKKADDLNRDWEGYLRQMHLLSNKARMALEIPQPDKKHFKAFKQLLFKWKDTFQLRTENQHIQILSAYIERDDPLRPEIYGDEALLEQLVYNLLDNAVKYSYMGTKISLDCRKEDDQVSTPHVLTVTNYGIEIKKSRKLFELEYRGKNVAGIDGLGIGLYLANQIAKGHDGTITHTCRKISRYNVPLMAAYLCSETIKKDPKIVQSITMELKDLKRSGEYVNIMAFYDNKKPDYFEPSPDEIVDYIKKQTWKVTFKVTIPAY
ncbi:MAG: HAMP domain-containing histidine kinase [candidate division Zixibacteria bacterium]|nr:HAMP domain-containing histidine kinase [candidate division Zixibacteria bacterium]